MVDTHGRFKVANGGRNPSPAETEYCALRNPEHPSAPISSSTLFLEQLSHQLGRDHTQQQSIMGSDYPLYLEIILIFQNHYIVLLIIIYLSKEYRTYK